MKQPNFFVVGAPKSGTTALATYLGEHPEIFMCSPKEPHYFADDFPNHRFVTRWDDYLGLFERAGDHHRVVGEASVFYLYSKVAITNLLARIPSARLIVMLRNPIELAQSMHAQALRTRDETSTDFCAAWNLRNTRRRGQRIPRKCRDVKILLYDDVARLGSQMERLLAVAPRNQVRWWFYDDFADDPKRVYGEVLEFLRVANDGRSEFPPINLRSVARSQLVAQFTQKTPRTLVKAAMLLKKHLGIDQWRILDALRCVNFTQVTSNYLAPELLAQMRRHFAPDIRLLQDISGRDLSYWLRALG